MSSQLVSWLESAGLTGLKLEKVLSLCEAAFIESTKDLFELYTHRETSANWEKTFPQGMLRDKLARAIETAMGEGTNEKAPSTANHPSTSSTEDKRHQTAQAPTLPPGKKTHYFLSHKKLHSKFGELLASCNLFYFINCWLTVFRKGGTSETLAVGMKETLKHKAGLEGWLDVDNLQV